MKKHTPDPREKAAKRFGFIWKSILTILVLTVVAAGIKFAFDRVETINESQTSIGSAGAANDASDPDISVISSDASASLTGAAEAAAVTSMPTQSSSEPSVSSVSSGSSASSASSAMTAAQTESAAAFQTSAETAAVLPEGNGGDGPDLSGYVVVLDPGHQLHADSAQEALGPDMKGTKDKCSSGTAGVSTGRPEYEVNLEIGLKMRDYLESLGCEVYMTRTTNDVDISNIDRANIALSHSPDVYIRLHCDGSTNSSSRGIGVFVADSGQYAGSISDWGDLLGGCLADATGANYRGCNAGSTYSGLNWAADIPSFLLEMGFMSNATDDKLLSDPDYQQKICEGVADFVSQMPDISG